MEAAPAGPDTCSARPGVIARGQDESDRMLRQDLHSGALQGGPAVRPGAHAAGVAAVPEDAREGERGAAGGARAGREEEGAAVAWDTREHTEAKAPARCPDDWVATLRVRRAPRRLDLSHYLGHNF